MAPVSEIDSRYVLLIRRLDSGGTRWRADVATSDRLTSGWKKAPRFHRSDPVARRLFGRHALSRRHPRPLPHRRALALYFQAAHSAFISASTGRSGVWTATFCRKNAGLPDAREEFRSGKDSGTSGKRFVYSVEAGADQTHIDPPTEIRQGRRRHPIANDGETDGTSFPLHSLESCTDENCWRECARRRRGLRSSLHPAGGLGIDSPCA